jgi:peptidoglycan L-alanyl-D-glutamate endopeptidase CwlK
MFTLSQRSLDRLVGVHPDLVRVVHGALAVSKVDFVVIEGLRSLDGDGKTEISWSRSHFYPIVDAMHAASAALKVQLTWGGDWQTFVDMPHWELPWSKYP